MSPTAVTAKRSVKRKTADKPSSTRKKLKTQHCTLNELPWKKVVRPQEAGLDGDDGIIELEEIEGVDVVYEEGDGGRVIKFAVVEEEVPDLGDSVPDALFDAEHEVRETITEPIFEPAVEEAPTTFDSAELLPNWHNFSLHPRLLKALHARGFKSPTPIQAASLPVALSHRDVVGVAQTRLKAKAKAKAEPSAAPTKKSPPHVSVAAIVGGMSAQKQRRILDRGVDVLVATPGRLWDLMEDDDTLSREIKTLRFLVLDEADRMIEAGHFAELENILRLTLRENQNDQIEADADEQPREEEEDSKEGIKDGLQTFVFSATLSKDLQKNVKRRSRPKSAGKYKKRNDKPASTLDDLLLRLDFRDPDPQVIDLSPSGGVVSTLQESKIECLSADKDVFLYYFLLRHPGKSLVFLSSIDGIRRLMPLTELLNIKAFPLHSQLEQRQRLKNLDRFTNTPNSVLLATDIAARGLDIPAVDHVIHYQIPRSADAYVHRNGRTARAMRKGFSLLMCAPDEKRVVRALLGNLGRQEDEIQEISVELAMLDKLKYRVQLARKIETTHHKIKKANHDRNWMKETAEAMEIELDSDYLSDDDDEKPSNQKRKAKDAKNAVLKAELKHLLSQPLIARGVSARYITSGSRPIVDDLIAGASHEIMVGLKKEDAGSGLVDQKKKKKLPVKEEDEEWSGIDV
ncbi:hypothetical protein H0H87_012635 [Tephrocybe sp. NHM501043]|nr:hypothetical protein H0H87_012635 [Tephrocybe sp. NHM501043]